MMLPEHCCWQGLHIIFFSIDVNLTMTTLIIDWPLKIKVHLLVLLWLLGRPTLLNNLLFCFVLGCWKGLFLLLFIIMREEAYITAVQYPSVSHDGFHGLACAVTCFVSCRGVQNTYIGHGVQGDSSFHGLLHPVEGDTVVICVTAGAMSNWGVVSCLLCPMLGAQEF